MKKKKIFSVVSRAWYGKHVKTEELRDSISIHFTNPDEYGSCIGGEIMLNWKKIDSSDICARLEIFQDGWKTLYEMPELLKFLSEVSEKNLTVEEVVQGLCEIGFEDATEYTMPMLKI